MHNLYYIQFNTKENYVVTEDRYRFVSVGGYLGNQPFLNSFRLTLYRE
jgi:hypothetical protein